MSKQVERQEKGQVESREEQEEAVETRGVRVESVVHLEDWVKKQEVKPKQVHQGVLLAEVHEENFPLEGQLHQAYLLIVFHLIALQVLLLMQVSEVLVVFIVREYDTYDED